MNLLISIGASVARFTVLLSVALLIGAGSASAQARNTQHERYVPTIWVDPDGCQHWVMDDGAEGYMTPNVDRNGIPVCEGNRAIAQQSQICGLLGDQYFATDKYYISAQGQAKLREFFKANLNQRFIIVGHTDSRASDAYNLRLSLNRANAVASIARSVGATVVDVQGKGEREPVASNSTTVGMAQNRRVEILCVK